MVGTDTPTSGSAIIRASSRMSAWVIDKSVTATKASTPSSVNQAVRAGEEMSSMRLMREAVSSAIGPFVGRNNRETAKSSTHGAHPDAISRARVRGSGRTRRGL